MIKIFFLLLLTISANAQMGELTNEKLTQLLHRDDVVLIDIRTPEEWKETGIVPKSKRITFYFEDAEGDRYMNPQFVKQLKSAGVTEKTPIILICANGNRSVVAFNFLDDLGFEEIYNVTKGTNGWLKSGRKLINIDY